MTPHITFFVCLAMSNTPPPNPSAFSRLVGSIKRPKSDNLDPTSSSTVANSDSTPSNPEKPKRSSSFLKLAHAVGVTTSGWLEDKKEAIQWPPAEWFRTETGAAGEASGSVTTDPIVDAVPKIALEGEPTAVGESGEVTVPPARPPSPNSLARRIKSMIGTLSPPPVSPTTKSSPAVSDSKDSTAEASKAHREPATPVPEISADHAEPPPALQAIRVFLTNGSLMNGSSNSKGVWAALDRLKPPAIFRSRGTFSFGRLIMLY